MRGGKDYQCDNTSADDGLEILIMHIRKIPKPQKTKNDKNNGNEMNNAGSKEKKSTGFNSNNYQDVDYKKGPMVENPIKFKSHK